MNELLGLKNFNFNFILLPHEEEFEEQVINAYMDIETQYPPNALDEIPFTFISENTGIFVPAYLGKRSLNPQHFFEFTRNMSENEITNLINEEIMNYEQQVESNIMFGQYQYFLYQDIISVLNYYKMSYVSIDGFHNMPWKPVW